MYLHTAVATRAVPAAPVDNTSYLEVAAYITGRQCFILSTSKFLVLSTGHLAYGCSDTVSDTVNSVEQSMPGRDLGSYGTSGAESTGGGGRGTLQ